ncbi:MAG: hypothetical protein ABSD21_09545 [Rhizomicrobium sp.]|jgi:hypothetical protein
MADVIDEMSSDAASSVGSPACGRIAIPVKLGHKDERVVELKLGSSVTVILDIIAAERCCLVEELILRRDGEDEPLTSVVVITADYPHHHRHHVHFKGEVRVNVNYQTAQTREFKRDATVEDILEWAIKEFKIDPNMASEFDLALHGTKETLPPDEHVGHLAGRHDELALDLLRGDISNGSCA